MFADILTGDPTRAKQELQKRITKLVLSPKETPNGNVFEVSGDKHAAAAHRSASGPALCEWSSIGQLRLRGFDRRRTQDVGDLRWTDGVGRAEGVMRAHRSDRP